MGGFTIWQGLGIVVGAIAGFYTGGAGWALAGSIIMGASVGYAIGSAIDPQTPDMPQPGEPKMGELDIPTAEEGGVIPDALGTVKMAGNILWYGGARTEEVTEEQEVGGGGKGGGGGSTTQTVTVGYKYYLSWALGLCIGPVDELITVLRGDEVVWEGSLLLSSYSGGVASITCGNMGTCYFFFGTTTQPKMSTMSSALGTANNPSYRGLCYAFMNDAFIGDYNRAPAMRFVFRKTPVFSFHSANRIGLYDYNPIHACYYVLKTMAGLPDTWFDETGIASAASEIAGVNEGHGISITFGAQRSAQTYLETILSHVDGLMRYTNESKFTFELMRATTAASELKLIDDDDFLEEPMVSRKTWLDVVSDVRVQHHIRYNVDGEVQGLPDIYSFSFCDESCGGSTWNGPYTVSNTDLSPWTHWYTDYAAALVSPKPGQKGDSRWFGFMGHIGDASGHQTNSGNTVVPDGYSTGADLLACGITYFKVNYSPSGQEGVNALAAQIASTGYRTGSWFVFSRDITGSNDATQLANGAAQIANLKAYLNANYPDRRIYSHDETLTNERWLNWIITNVTA
ncbi:MAG: hypothetical protein ACYTBJ_00925 [Planctomycetota bacterium]|jgi:hypothetical protein